MNENKKSNKGLILTVIVLVLALLGAIYYIYYLITTNNTKSVETTEKKENATESKTCEECLASTDSEATELFDTITSGTIGGFHNYFSNKKITISDLDNSMVALIAKHSIYKDKVAAGETNIFSKVGDAFTSEELHKKIAKYFGSDYKFTDANFDTCPVFEYKANEKKYVITQEPACGGASGPTNMERIVKVTKNDKEMIMYVKVLFYNRTNNIYYYDYNKTMSTTYTADNLDLYIYDDIIAKGAEYKLTFKKENSNYVFVSSEPVK